MAKKSTPATSTPRTSNTPGTALDILFVTSEARPFGKTGGLPLVFNQHFRGTMDYWYPAVTNGLARNR